MCFVSDADKDHVPCVGLVSQTLNWTPDGEQVKTVEDIKNAAKEGERINGTKVNTLDWPTIEEQPFSEYGDTKIFALAFPWLFPGGHGDYVDRQRTDNLSVEKWGRILLGYKDGRFQCDPVFSFFVLNYIQRRQNQDQGSVYVKTVLNEPSKTLEELKSELLRGNDKFIRQMSYFSQRVKGSDAYWRGKRYEVYSWINHHLDQKNGLPNLFITLSCAEYWWPDLRRLIEERVMISCGMQIDMDGDEKVRYKYLNDYSYLVQEYFQIRTEEWINSVGAKVFGIKHYWVRYEFAKGRGQTHAHMIAMCDTTFVNGEGKSVDMMMVSYINKDDPGKRAELIDEWARTKFGMTAKHPGLDDSANSDINTTLDQEEPRAPPTDDHPCSVYYGSRETNLDKRNDQIGLCSCCQIHQCSGYCLTKTHSSKKRIYNERWVFQVCEKF